MQAQILFVNDKSFYPRYVSCVNFSNYVVYYVVQAVCSLYLLILFIHSIAMDTLLYCTAT